MDMNELQARELIAERIRRAQAPRMPTARPRQRLATRLRQIADRIDH